MSIWIYIFTCVCKYISHEIFTCNKKDSISSSLLALHSNKSICLIYFTIQHHYFAICGLFNTKVGYLDQLCMLQYCTKHTSRSPSFHTTSRGLSSIFHTRLLPMCTIYHTQCAYIPVYGVFKPHMSKRQMVCKIFPATLIWFYPV